MAARPSEAIEFYLYFFIVAYLIVFERRIHALEVENSNAAAKGSSAKTRTRAKTPAKTRKAAGSAGRGRRGR